MTHEVSNQPPPLGAVNYYDLDATLRLAVAAYGGDWADAELSSYGALAGAELADLGRLANRYPPELATHDAYGRRIDEVRFLPAYHRLMSTAVSHGVHALAWEGHPAGHVVRAALELLHNQADSGTDCPLTMTYASVPSLRANPALAEEWLPRVVSREYDGAARPYFEKPGVTIGMAMTEKQGGTDVRANTTRAQPLNERVGGGECFALTGHKWFCSAPMSDAFLTLAQLDGELTCFLLPRWTPDGQRNTFRLQRLKEKLGNRSNASAEVELEGTFAWLLGEPGQGVRTIIQMVSLTRFNCMVGSTAIMRQAMIQVLHHIRHRKVGGRLLIEQPLMRNVVADLLLETEAALWFVFRVAAAIDRRENDPREAALVRLATALGKYWICKRAPQHINEAQECLGGLGYVEDSVLPRLYREAPVNSIWEGSGNVQCIDMLRSLARSPETVEVLFDELAFASGSHPAYDRTVRAVKNELENSQPDPFQARSIAGQMAVLIESRLLFEHAPLEVASAFVEARLTPRTLAYGDLGDRRAVDLLLEGAFEPGQPRVSRV